ncbi:hypothetical protein CMO96_00145 [Candidatus Woesebacteria bacterium]|nr:hypothetical protein [Candidatus Woesebacteria bacterium]|tara:strand:+ start:399 stop:740 length:342 start_codon:yes stop_codon:yes gene_type:complete
MVIGKKRFSLILVVLIGLLVFLFFRRHEGGSISRSSVGFLEGEIRNAEDENERLEDSVKEAETDAFVEEVARESLQLQFPGETVLFVNDEEVKKEIKEEIPFWKEWFNSVFGG